MNENNAFSNHLQDFFLDERSNLNQEFFDIKKALTKEEFDMIYPNKQYHILNLNSYQKYLVDIGSEIQKGIEIVDLTLELTKENIRNYLKQFKKVNLFSKGVESVYFVINKNSGQQATEKSEKSDIEKGVKEFGYNAKFKKTGKQIKEKIPIVKALIEAKKKTFQAEMNECWKVVDFNPIQDFDDWETRGFGHLIADLPKRYSYLQCNFTEQLTERNDLAANQIEFDFECCKTKEQADCCHKYNKAAKGFLNCCVDLIMLDSYERNLNDKEIYDLHPEDAVAMGF